MKFRVPPDHPSLPGHFPGRPLVPGVVVLDHVLQALAAIDAKAGALALPQVKFLQPLLPDQEAEVILERRGDAWRFRVLHGEVTIASGDIKPR